MAVLLQAGCPFCRLINSAKPIGVGDGERGHLPPPPEKKSETYFSGKYDVKIRELR